MATTLRIAVQTKGRLYEETMTMLSESSIKVDPVKRTLLVPAKNFPVEILYLRDDDIPQAVASGTADVGIVGENEYEERQEDAEIVKRLDFSKCRLSLAIPKHQMDEYEKVGLKWFDGKRIATSYPGILGRFLTKNGIKADIHVITGSVEIAPGINLSDAIFDIVSSGSTLVSNNLVEVEVVMQSEAVLIGNKKLSEEKKEILKELLFRFDSYKNAEGKKYIVLNIKTEKLGEVAKLLPGLKAPTVTALETEGWSSVASVIEEKHFWEIISGLKQLGAEGILVMPIEKMIM
ncbi:MAG: ATP phosphoribosyltransferase [Bacteroidales bacterium]|nr:ATP phosphoribosyltransferase [Bacteroidales bacterium]